MRRIRTCFVLMVIPVLFIVFFGIFPFLDIVHGDENIYQIILKNEKIDRESGSKWVDIYFIINGNEYLVSSDTWIISNYQEYKNKGKKLIGCSMGEKGNALGYNEYWIEKSGEYLVIKGYYVGGNAQTENYETINKIKNAMTKSNKKPIGTVKMPFAKKIVKLETTDITMASDKKLTGFIENGWDFKLGCSVKEIIGNLGKPKNIIKKGPMHGGEITGCPNTFRYTLKYEGLEVTTFEVKGGKNCFIIKCPFEVIITNSKYKVKYGIGIGSTKESVQNVLGKPHYEEGNAIIYFIDPEDGITPGSVKIYFKINHVYKIEWSE